MDESSDTPGVARTCVVFATPSLDHRVCLEFFRSAMETEWLLSSKSIGHGYKQVAGDQFIAKARNRLVYEFLTEFPMATDLFFIDDDIGWPAAKVIEFLERPEPVLAGAYPKKTDTPEWPAELVSREGKLVERDGLFEAIMAPTGFMRIKRHVLEELAAISQPYREPDLNGVLQPRWAIFESGRHESGEWWGEDYTFCQKWRGLGGEIWIDPDVPFTHRGNKRWSGTFLDAVTQFHTKNAAWLL